MQVKTPSETINRATQIFEDWRQQRSNSTYDCIPALKEMTAEQLEKYLSFLIVEIWKAKQNAVTAKFII